MPDDNKKAEAYRMAQLMDEQIGVGKDIDDREKLQRFLEIISMIESSGGRNFSHEEIPAGIHEGHRAIGTYGLMPNTVKEMSERMRRDGTLSQDTEKYSQMTPQEMKSQLEQDPEAERQFAEALGQKVLGQYDNDEKAAYSWFQGHNIDKERMEQEPYEAHPYTEKYRRFKKRLFGDEF